MKKEENEGEEEFEGRILKLSWNPWLVIEHREEKWGEGTESISNLQELAISGMWKLALGGIDKTV